MGTNFNTTLQYDWWTINPSEDIALPPILGGVFDIEQACGWMSVRAYKNEARFDQLYEMYTQMYPNLFNQLDAFCDNHAQSPAVLENAEELMKHYHYGATMALSSLEASTPEGYLKDIASRYGRALEELDMIDIELWVLGMRVSIINQIAMVTEFIDNEYLLSTEPEAIRTAMHVGSQCAYILMTHNLACIRREEELSWEMH